MLHTESHDHETVAMSGPMGLGPCALWSHSTLALYCPSDNWCSLLWDSATIATKYLVGLNVYLLLKTADKSEISYNRNNIQMIWDGSWAAPPACVWQCMTWGDVTVASVISCQNHGVLDCFLSVISSAFTSFHHHTLNPDNIISSGIKSKQLV